MKSLQFDDALQNGTDASSRINQLSRTRSGNGRHRWATLAVLCVTLLLISLDNTVLNVALPSIVRSIGASSSQLQWMVDAYAVVFAGLLLSLGALGDRVGRKWVFMAGLVVFGGGSAFAAWSGNPDPLTLARAVMGLGAAALMPCTLSILTNVFTAERDRVRAIGIWSGTTGLGVALGPILGGFLLAHFWWGSVFLVNVPVALIGLITAVWLVPNSKNPTATRPDLVGAGCPFSDSGCCSGGSSKRRAEGGHRRSSWERWPPRLWLLPSSSFGNAVSIIPCFPFASFPTAATARPSRRSPSCSSPFLGCSFS